MKKVEVPFNIPEDSMLVATVSVISYIDSEAQLCYATTTTGEGTLSSSLGLLTLAEHELVSRAVGGDE